MPSARPSSGCSRCSTPLPSSSVLLSSARSSASFSGVITRSPTGSSSVCSLKRSRRGNGSSARNSPSTRRWRVAARLGPFGEVGVDALAVDDQRREQADVLALWSRSSCAAMLSALCGLHRRAVVHAVLQAELDLQQAQEVPDLGGGGHRALAAAAASGAARSPPWAGCRRPRPPRAGPPAARCCARRRSAFRGSAAGLR